MTNTTTTTINLRAAIAAAVAESERFIAQRQAEDKQRERELNIRKLEDALNYALGNDLASLAHIVYGDGVIAEVDGLRFIVAGGHNRGLRVQFPCPDCGEPIWSETFSNLAGLGYTLEQPTGAYGEYGPWHKCPAKAVPDPEAEADNVAANPAPAKAKTLAEQLDHIIRSIVADEINRRQED